MILPSAAPISERNHVLTDIARIVDSIGLGKRGYNLISHLG